MRPPMPYFGGKQTTAEAIVALFPPHEMYVEPFGGGLSVLLAKPMGDVEVVNDLDGDLVNFWRVLRDRPDELWQVCEATPHSREEFDKSLDYETDDLERARRIWVRLTQGRSAQVRKTGWRHSTAAATAPGASLPAYMAGYRKRLLPAAERLQNVTLESRPALEVIRQYGNPGTLLYVDPPYLGTTRSSSGYRFDMTADSEHAELLTALVETDAMVVLSGYAAPLYEDMLSDWHRHEMGTHTQEGAGRVEVVWSNTEDETALFSMAGLGHEPLSDRSES